MHTTKNRRRYHEGLRCDDCGIHRATVVHWWLNNERGQYCSDCIKPYRPSLLKPCACEGN